MTRPPTLALTLLLAALLAPASAARAQVSSLYQRDFPVRADIGQRLPEASLIYQPPPPVREIGLNDLLTIRVDQKARFFSEGELERRRNAQYDLVLLDWIFLEGLKAIRPSPQRLGDQRIRGQLNQLDRADGSVETLEAMTFDIAARVVDIRPNGTLVLEAHQQVRNNDEVWEYSLSGICRKEDILENNVVLSKNIYELSIHKRERGMVRDAYNRGWFSRWFDLFDPF